MGCWHGPLTLNCSSQLCRCGAIGANHGAVDSQPPSHIDALDQEKYLVRLFWEPSLSSSSLYSTTVWIVFRSFLLDFPYIFKLGSVLPSRSLGLCIRNWSISQHATASIHEAKIPQASKNPASHSLPGASGVLLISYSGVWLHVTYYRPRPGKADKVVIQS